MLDWELDCFDAKHAFLHRKLKEDLYMKQPRGFEKYSATGTLLICHLLSSLYGLKQAALDWYKLLSSILVALGFFKSKVDFAVFVYVKTLGDGCYIICIIAWHVDDGLGGSNSRTFLDWVKGQIKDRFGISNMGAISMYLGIEVEHNRVTREAWVHQEAYISYLCDEYGLSDCNPVSMPMDPNHPFGRDDEVLPVIPDLVHAYRKIVGELIYLLTCTRPDIVFAVQHLAQHSAHPEARHLAMAKRVV